MLGYHQLECVNPISGMEHYSLILSLFFALSLVDFYVFIYLFIYFYFFFFFIHMNKKKIYVVSRVCLSDYVYNWPADLPDIVCLASQTVVLRDKNFQILSYLPYLEAPLTSTILYLLSVTVVLEDGHKVSGKQNLLVSFSCTEWYLIWCWRNSSWTSRCCFWVKFL